MLHWNLCYNGIIFITSVFQRALGEGCESNSRSHWAGWSTGKGAFLEGSVCWGCLSSPQGNAGFSSPSSVSGLILQECQAVAPGLWYIGLSRPAPSVRYSQGWKHTYVDLSHFTLPWCPFCSILFRSGCLCPTLFGKYFRTGITTIAKEKASTCRSWPIGTWCAQTGLFHMNKILLGKVKSSPNSYLLFFFQWLLAILCLAWVWEDRSISLHKHMDNKLKKQELPLPHISMEAQQARTFSCCRHMWWQAAQRCEQGCWEMLLTWAAAVLQMVCHQRWLLWLYWRAKATQDAKEKDYFCLSASNLC